MYIGVYLCLSGFFYLLGLVWLVRPGRRFLVYSSLALGLALLGLIAFEGLSALLGLSRIGSAGSWSYPDDYLARGLAGWAVMILPLLGMLSPLVAAFWLRRRGRSAA